MIHNSSYFSRSSLPPFSGPLCNGPYMIETQLIPRLGFQTGKIELCAEVSKRARGKLSSGRPHNEALQATIKQLVCHSYATRMFDWRNRILDHVLDVQVGPDLIKDGAHVTNMRVGEHDKL